MAYDNQLAERIRDLLQDQSDLDERPTSGGLYFILDGHLCCGVSGDMLMARVGPHAYEDCLGQPWVSEMDFTGKALAGVVFVAPQALVDDAALADWVHRCANFVNTLPAP
jgi:hypothetical protein